jgi:spermidine/putrescine transport system substrate-binding protein
MLRRHDTEGNAEGHPHRGARYARTLAIAGVGLAAALGIAACGGGGIEGGSSNANVETVKVTGKPTGDVTISNWPFYIDNQTVPNFEKATGLSVKYVEDVNDNAEFFAKVQPLLAKGQSGGRSMTVVTDWMAKKMYDLGYLQNLDPSALPNVKKNLLPTLRHPSFDPNRDFSVPWQSGYAGLIVNKAEAPDVHSINDLFDPKYKGKVEMLTELRDTLPLVMLGMGLNASDPSEADYMKAIDRIKAAVDSGQIRRFTGNDYTRDIANGDATAIIGWSGDAVQLQASNPDIEFRMPTEGCTLFSDDMVIPVGAPNPTAAEAFMNYVYDPKNQYTITEYNSYVTPVEGVRDLFRQASPNQVDVVPGVGKVHPHALVNDPLIFPSAQYTKNCVSEPTLTGAEEQRVTRAFEGLLTR